MKPAVRILFILTCFALMAGCQLPGFSHERQTSCSMNSGNARVILTVRAPEEDEDLSALEISLIYPKEQILSLCGIDPEKETEEAEKALKAALADVLGQSPDDIDADWSGTKMTLHAVCTDPGDTLEQLAGRPQTLRYSDVVAVLNNSPEFACQ